jgi:hypothetical protein
MPRTSESGRLLRPMRSGRWFSRLQHGDGDHVREARRARLRHSPASLRMPRGAIVAADAIGPLVALLQATVTTARSSSSRCERDRDSEVTLARESKRNGPFKLLDPLERPSNGHRDGKLI